MNKNLAFLKRRLKEETDLSASLEKEIREHIAEIPRTKSYREIISLENILRYKNHQLKIANRNIRTLTNQINQLTDV